MRPFRDGDVWACRNRHRARVYIGQGGIAQGYLIAVPISFPGCIPVFLRLDGTFYGRDALHGGFLWDLEEFIETSEEYERDPTRHLRHPAARSGRFAVGQVWLARDRSFVHITGTHYCSNPERPISGTPVGTQEEPTWMSNGRVHPIAAMEKDLIGLVQDSIEDPCPPEVKVGQVWLTANFEKAYITEMREPSKVNYFPVGGLIESTGVNPQSWKINGRHQHDAPTRFDLLALIEELA